MTNHFFPYHPLKARLMLLSSCVACVGLAAWAVHGALSAGEVLEWARAGLCAGLLFSMLWVWAKLTPRSDWGVRLGPTALTVSRPMQGLIEIPWSAVRQVKRSGARRQLLVVSTADEREVLVPRHLFASKRDFEALASAIDERLPPSGHDA